ncbi:MAG TPA: sirohydrochlorin chelatase [Nocardioidaceae bacterium]|nr:sirohydrochlorin chelatase [Nocardioidaceae bacterium]
MRARLVTVAHGTRNAAGPEVVRALVRQVRRRLPSVDVAESYVELVEPSFSSVMTSSESPSVVVPLLLSTGYHVTTDLPESAALSPHEVTLTRPLGPHPLLAAVMGLRLRAAGARRGDAVVMIAAGSSDPDAAVDTYVAGRMLQAHWGAPVVVGHLSGSATDVPDAMAELRAQGHRRIAAVPYLLAPGYFATKADVLAKVNGAVAVADVLGPHPLVAELVARRYLAATRQVTAARVRVA